MLPGSMAWRDVAAADLTEGLHPVTLADGRGLVIVHCETRWWALRDICPHQGAKLALGSVMDVCLPAFQENRSRCPMISLCCSVHGMVGSTTSKQEDASQIRITRVSVCTR
jgi:nitrite reductase/ring-hydroxylating ferredoxin subunit